MKIEDWKQGIEAWEKVKKQAMIDMEQAELYIQAINLKIADIVEKEKEINRGK